MLDGVDMPRLTYDSMKKRFELVREKREFLASRVIRLL